MKRLTSQTTHLLGRNWNATTTLAVYDTIKLLVSSQRTQRVVVAQNCLVTKRTTASMNEDLEQDRIVPASRILVHTYIGSYQWLASIFTSIGQSYFPTISETVRRTVLPRIWRPPLVGERDEVYYFTPSNITATIERTSPEMPNLEATGPFWDTKMWLYAA
ncbi:hypothetical protein VTO73DRAFT_12455 [Trametes versicolor]